MTYIYYFLHSLYNNIPSYEFALLLVVVYRWFTFTFNDIFIFFIYFFLFVVARAILYNITKFMIDLRAQRRPTII